MISYLCSMDYSKGKIYKIIDESNNDNYYGSTIQTLEDRYNTHQLFYGGTYNKSKKNCKIELVENYPCESKRELEKREQYYIDTYDCINQQPAYTSREQRLIYCNNKAKKHYHNNKVYRKEQILSWRNKNRDYVLNYQKNLSHYKNSWGGDKRCNNNLLTIDTDLFK